MRVSIIILLCVLAAAVIGGGYVAMERARTAVSPLAAYGTASADEAKAIGEHLATSLSAGQAKDFDVAFDLPAVVGEALMPVRLFPAERERFITNFTAGMNKATAGTLGVQLAAGAKGGMVKLIHVHEVAGRQRALVRFVNGDDALNYFDLVIGKDALGHARVINYYNFLNGQMFDQIVAGVALPTIAESRKTTLERLIDGGDRIDMSAFVEVTKLAAAGKHAEAVARWKELPEPLRASRVGLFLRMQCAQAIGGDEYQQAIDAITSAFPDDGSLALIQIDSFVLRKDWTHALASIDQVDRSVGGDPYLDCTRAGVLQVAGRFAEAEVAMSRYLAAEPGVKKAWWSAVDIALAAKDHAETARLLSELERRFHVTFKDLAKTKAYADFATSPEYAQWLARPNAQTGPQAERSTEAVVAEPVVPAPAAP